MITAKWTMKIGPNWLRPFHQPACSLYDKTSLSESFFQLKGFFATKFGINWFDVIPFRINCSPFFGHAIFFLGMDWLYLKIILIYFRILHKCYRICVGCLTNNLFWKIPIRIREYFLKICATWIITCISAQVFSLINFSHRNTKNPTYVDSFT